ncbi:MAG: type IV pilus modification protein PilV [Gammaproteobacteria bacterium]|nr:type IV pilus modification protein PilV [Gammaproteobacteria bacterium]
MGKQLKKSNKGFSLMEVLIAIIVVAIGLLGFLSLQLTSINSNQEGMARSYANLILQDAASKFRNNREYIFQQQGANLYLSANSDYNNCPDAAPAACSGAAANCNAQSQAEFDVWTICQSLKSFTPATTQDDPLINPRLFVSCDTRDAGNACASGSTLSAYLFWAMSERRQDVGQVKSANTGGVLSNRCSDYIDDANIDVSQIGAEVDCITIDIMP